MRFDIPAGLVEHLDESRLAAWHSRDSEEARSFGDRWLAEARSAVLDVPALPSRPVGRILLINPGHEDAGHVARGAPFALRWDERLF